MSGSEHRAVTGTGGKEAVAILWQVSQSGREKKWLQLHDVSLTLFQQAFLLTIAVVVMATVSVTSVEASMAVVSARTVMIGRLVLSTD
jgi:hypothetical protein